MYYYAPPKDSDLPIDENLMVFISSEEFTNSPLVFWEYIKNNKSYETVWIVYTEDTFNKLNEAGINCCSIHDHQGLDNLLSKAKYIIMDSRQPLIRVPVKGQVVVQLSALIAFGSDIFMLSNVESMNPFFMHKYNCAYTNIATASSQLMKANTAASYGYDARKIHVTGVPRTDVLLNEDGKKLLYEQFPDLKKYKKLLLFTPGAKNTLGGTKRFISKRFSANIFNIEGFDQKELEEVLEKNKIGVVFKLHPFDEYFYKSNQFPAKIPKHCHLIHTNTFFGKSLNHIMNAFDSMISDSSSTMYEYLLLNRPIIFLHNELSLAKEIYGVKYLIEDETVVYPGRRVYTFNELLDAISEALTTPEKFSSERLRTRELLYDYTDGKNCERVLELIEKYDPNKPVEDVEYKLYTHIISEERDGLLQERDGLLQERDGLLHVRDSLMQERDILLYVRDSLIYERDNLLHVQGGLLLERDNLVQERDGLVYEQVNLTQKLAVANEHYNAVISTRGYRFMRKFISITVPAGSIRRRVVSKILRMFTKRRDR